MSELSVFESAKQDYEKEIYDLKQEIEILRSEYKDYKSRIDKANEYLNKVRTFAMVDKINILSISTLENILKGSDNDE